VADALAAIHAADIVHRDLKPGNILLDRAGQPFLTDFGLARAADSEQLTAPGQFVGTPAYVAPEQANPELGAVGPGSDQYSLAVVLYQLLTGRLPFEGSASALIFQIATQTVPPPSQYRPELDASLERLLLKALARLPQDRYPNVTDLAQALRAWQEGAAVPTGRCAREAQHRRVTLLSCGCDVFDSDAIQAALDPEEQHDLLLEFQQLCRDVATPLAGTVVKATDRGLLICFGIPFALECAARRAVRTGLTLLDRMAAFNARLGKQHQDLHLSVRIAIHSGRAVVTENRGPAEAPGIVGQVVPAVDQLEYLAPLNTVVVSDETHRLLRGFVPCTSLATQQLKGVASAQSIYRVDRQRPPGIRGDGAGPTGLIPLIGRDREVALLEERWEQAVEGVSQVVLLVGEAGIGKSRQVRVLKEHVMGQHTVGRAAMIIEWPCILLTQNSSLFHAVEYFEGVLHLDPHEDSSRKLDKLVAYLEFLHLASAEAVAVLASLLSIPLDGRYPPLGMTPQRQKEKTFDLLLDWLRALTQRQPVLFIIEDLHWAGPTTLEFLELLVGRAQGTRLLVLLTFRPEFVPPWRARGHQTQVSLSRLSRRQTGELMLLKSGLPTIPQSVLEAVAGRTDGVPLFVEEVTAMLLEAGGLRVVDGAVQISDTFDVQTIPATLQDLLMARLDQMASNLDVVQLAATIGREFSYELLAAAASCSATALQQELAKLVDAELLFQHGRPPNARYQFKHALIQDTAYQALLKKKRQQFHVRLAEALEQRFPEICTAQPELLAHHFTEGNVALRAVEYWERAGERAQRRGAAVEAVGHFQRGLELIRILSDTPERHAQEIRLEIGLGMALEWTRGSGAPEVYAHYERAQGLCKASGSTAPLFSALYGRYRCWQLQGHHIGAQKLAEELLSLANREQNTGYLVAAHRALGRTLFFQGNHAKALPHLEKVLTVAATAELRTAIYQFDVADPWVFAHAYMSLAQWLLGYPERALEQCRQGLSLAEDLDHTFSLAVALRYAGWLYRFCHDLERTRATAARALALAREKGLPAFACWAKILSGWTLIDQGQGEQAVAEIRQGLVELSDLGANLPRTYFLAMLAEACGHAGRPEEGLPALTEGQELADATGGESYWQPELYRLKGELLFQHDPTKAQDAEACFRGALDVARRQQARSLELRAATSLARLWHQQGKTQAARELLAPVYGSFTEGFQTHDLQQARALLEQCQSEEG
jgi:class 3 adenylate cyclase/tetratricopeptide (TPR) repeat protein